MAKAINDDAKQVGYISLHRRIRDHWIWKDEKKLKWWLDILMECNHSTQRVNIGFELLICERGQSLNSQLTWAKSWSVEPATVRRFLKLLENEKMIVIENLRKTTRLTICNYDNYNGGSISNGVQNLSKRLSNDFTAPTNNNDNNEENVKKGTNVPSEPMAPDVVFKEEYAALQKTKEKIFYFIKNKKPTIGEPYKDLWNIYATDNKRSLIKDLTEKRRRKLILRLKDPEFNFIEILTKAKASDFLMVNSFFSFDWLITNQENYLKVLEGNYDNNHSTPIIPINNGVTLSDIHNQKAEEILSAGK